MSYASAWLTSPKQFPLAGLKKEISERTEMLFNSNFAARPVLHGCSSLFIRVPKAWNFQSGLICVSSRTMKTNIRSMQKQSISCVILSSLYCRERSRRFGTSSSIRESVACRGSGLPYDSPGTLQFFSRDGTVCCLSLRPGSAITPTSLTSNLAGNMQTSAWSIGHLPTSPCPARQWPRSPQTPPGSIAPGPSSAIPAACWRTRPALPGRLPPALARSISPTPDTD